MQVSIPNLKVKDMDKLTDEEAAMMERCFKYLSASRTLGRLEGAILEELSFAEVTNIRSQVETDEGLIDAMCVVWKTTKELIVDYRIIQFFQARNWLLQEIKRINELEYKALSREPDQKMVEAGVRELDKFGVVNTLDRLAMRYSTNPMEVEQWPYGFVFTILWKATIDDDIQKNLSKTK